MCGVGDRVRKAVKRRIPLPVTGRGIATITIYSESYPRLHTGHEPRSSKDGQISPNRSSLLRLALLLGILITLSGPASPTA